MSDDIEVLYPITVVYTALGDGVACSATWYPNNPTITVEWYDANINEVRHQMVSVEVVRAILKEIDNYAQNDNDTSRQQ